MPDGEDFVSGGSVEWGRLAGAMAGAVLTLVGYAIGTWAELSTGALNATTAGLQWFSSSLIARPFEGGLEIMASAWSAFVPVLSVLGPAAFPAAVATTLIVFLVLIWGAQRLIYGI